MSLTPDTTAAPATPADTTTATAARWAGLSYLAIFGLALFANFAVLTGLVDADDPAGTVESIAANESVFRMGIAAFGVVFVLDIAVAWALHVIFRRYGAQRSLLAAWFRLSYTVMLGVAVAWLYLALLLAKGSAPASGLAAGAREAWTMLAVDAFEITWLVGLAAFGVHLVLIGRILLLNGLAPRLLGAILIVAGSAYVLDTFAHVVLADYASYANAFLLVVALPSIVGELWFTGWLFLRAGRLPAAKATNPAPEPDLVSA